MKKFTCVSLILALAIVWIPNSGLCVQRLALIDFGTYTFQNVGDLGFLTSVGGTEFIVTDVWRDIPGQKWKVTKGYLYTSYLFKPTSEGLSSKIAMTVTTDNGMSIVKKEPYTFGMSSSLYWSVIPAEGSFYMIQNLKDDLCLESMGLGKSVAVSPCRNAKNQQWAVHSR
ncbi:unnamed protein product [Orchesella dallaii]|uniref:Ricin B lectin domain-containing protein n=1 Tax=Orchesella dallaii TaxID=48710 RepID=A0ABP1QN46_9HEXA